MSFLQQLLKQFSTSSSPAVMSNVSGPIKAKIPQSVLAKVPNAEAATVAAGCFWGVEHVYRKQFRDNGLLDARVGYIGGNISDPSYKSVCSGRTGHAEALQIYYDPSKLSYKTLIEFFYKIHDPTTANRQGPDTGSQYRSGIFYHDEEQHAVAKEVTEKAQKDWWKEKKIVTAVVPAGEWWDAEDYHQKYLIHNPGGYECPTHYVRNFS